MKIELGPRVKDIEGLVEAFANLPPSSGAEVVSVRLIGLRRHLARTLRVVIVKKRLEGVGEAAVSPS